MGHLRESTDVSDRCVQKRWSRAINTDLVTAAANRKLHFFMLDMLRYTTKNLLAVCQLHTTCGCKDIFVCVKESKAHCCDLPLLTNWFSIAKRKVSVDDSFIN